MQYRILKELQRRGYILGLQTGEDTEFKVASIVTAPHSFFNLSSESKVTTNSSQLFGELRNFVEFTLLTRSPKLLPTHSEGVTQIFDRILKERKVQLLLGKAVVGVRKLR